MNLPVVYEDDWLVVVNKPSGLLTIPTPKNEHRTLTSILNEDLKEKGIAYRMHPCHRLDRETSGLIIYAKGKAIQKKMMGLFASKKIRKKYIVFVKGNISGPAGAIKFSIGRLPAVTTYKVIGEKKGFSIVEAMPLTGRTNQLRIHFNGIGHPIMGETKFAFRRDFELKAKRLCLHAQDLEFVHPVTQKNIHLHLDLPQDLKDFLTRNLKDD